MNIEFVEYGLANRFNDCIEINKNLVNYPELYKNILDHELSHTDKAFTLHDFKLDLTESHVDSFATLKFMLRYPKAFTQLLPFYFSKKHGFVFDINLIIIYLFCIGLFAVEFYAAYMLLHYF